MKIGIDYTSALTQGAGIGRLTRGLVHAVERIDRDNDYTLVVPRVKRRIDIGPLATNFQVRQLPFGERAMIVLWHRLRLPFPVESFVGKLDIYHSPDFVLPPVQKARTVLTVHDLSFVHYPEAAPKSLVGYLNRVVPRSVSRADLVVADSESTKQDLIEQFNVDAGRIRVVYGGVDERFKPDEDAQNREEIALRYGMQLPALLAVGTLQPRKNLDRLIDAFVLLRDRGNLTHRLYIAGAAGWSYSDLFVKIEELGLQPFVRFLGYVADEDLPALYSLADVFVYPSLYEGFGLPVLEAMACGTPVVCSNVSSIPEVGGDAAIYCDPLDVESIAAGIERALGDRELRKKMIGLGREHASEFTWASAGRALLSVYRELGAA